MKPYDYAAPATLDEALRILASANGEIRPLAGGTDLIAQIKERRKQPSLVLDVKRIPDCRRLDFAADGLHIGAAATCTSVADHPQVQKGYPMLVEAARLIGSVQIQNRASVGGNVCNAAPSADVIPALICHEARAIIARPKGRREVPIEHFFTGPGSTVLARGELLVEIVVPPPAALSAGCYMRFIPRAEMDIAVAGVGSRIAIDPRTKQCTYVRIALAAVAPTPVRATEAERTLIGKPLTRALIEEAGRKAVASAKPITDVRGTIEYRKELVQVLTRRTVTKCAADLGVTL